MYSNLNALQGTNETLGYEELIPNHDSNEAQNFSKILYVLASLIDREAYDQVNSISNDILINHPNDIQKFCFLLANPSNPNETRRYSAKIISYLLNPATPERRNILVNNIWSLNGFIPNLKRLITTTIGENDTVIRNVSCQIYSYIFGIEGGQWVDGIQEIFSSLSTSNSSILTSFFNIYSNILNLPNFESELKTDAHIPIYANIFDASFKILSIPDQISEVRESACDAIYFTILHLSDKIIDDNAEVKISIILQSIQSSLFTPNIKLFETLHNIMLLLIKKYYPLSPSFMGIISNCVLRGMAMSNPEHQCVSITFWQDLAQFEYAYQNRPTFKCDLLHLSRTVIENYFEIFINILQSIDPNDVSIEDPGDKLPHMRATTALQSIYKVEPEIVFEKCSQTIINLIKEQQSWVHCHTALLLIYSILEHPINNVIFLPFLGNVFDYVIDFCTPKYCAHLRETA